MLIKWVSYLVRHIGRFIAPLLQSHILGRSEYVLSCESGDNFPICTEEE